jgi:aryl-alcohol dehydrogenase-like predicted oxidoreductase
MRAERFDFLQINYSLDEREAERLGSCRSAAERGMAVLINRPVRRRWPAPPVCATGRCQPGPAEIGAASWAQLLLKFVLSQSAVTCAIPGTSRPEHMADNAGAGIGHDSRRRLLASVTRSTLETGT